MVEDINVTLPDKNVMLSALVRRSGGEWVFCLHGIQTNKTLFSGLLNNPNFDGYSFLCPDFIGFGDSEKPNDFSYDLQEQMGVIVALLDHMEIDRVLLVGHSLGGMVGTMMLRDIPDRVSAFCSIEGNLRLDDCGASREAVDVSQNEFEKGAYPNLMEALQNSQKASAGVRFNALAQVPAHVFYKTSRSIVAYSKDARLFDVFCKSNVCRMLLVGENGSFSSRPTGDDLQIVSISNAGHFVPLDNPAQFERTLLSFLLSTRS